MLALQNEDVTTTSPLMNRLNRYHLYDVASLGHSFKDLLELPRELVDAIYDIARKRKAEKEKKNSRDQEEVDKALRGL